VVDGLAAMVDAARRASHISGLVPDLVEGGVNMLQYADDMVILLGKSDLNVLHMKFLLYCFDSMSGMKINYHKSKVFVLGCDVEEQQRVANLFNCKLGALPMVYLGVPIGEYRLNNEHFMPLSGKMTKRMDPWKGKLMSSAAKLTLSNACLANLPTFMMGFNYLGEGVHGEMDKVRGRFYWEGDAQTFKYHKMKWENVCRPKEYGGLGIINTRFMNIALLLKWIWKLFNCPDETPWIQMINNKYLKHGESILMNNSRGSQFWNGLQDVKKWFTWGAVHIVGDGKRTRFWHDVWIGSVPLKMIFPKLFLAALNPDASVAMNYDLNSHSWDIRFKRVFGREEMRSWEHLLQMLEPIFLSDQKDRVKWAFEKDGE
jgi:hypothetical protein